jgi:hypothetical protein
MIYSGITVRNGADFALIELVLRPVPVQLVVQRDLYYYIL